MKEQIEDITKLELIPLFHAFWDALKAEEYEICALVKQEIEFRRLTKTLCPFAVTILQNSDYSLYGMLDGGIINIKQEEK